MSDNKVMFRYSDDGGHTWSAEQWRDMGASGEYQVRIVLPAQGSAVDRVYEIVTTAPVAPTLIAGWADVEASRQ